MGINTTLALVEYDSFREFDGLTYFVLRYQSFKGMKRVDVLTAYFQSYQGIGVFLLPWRLPTPEWQQVSQLFPSVDIVAGIRSYIEIGFCQQLMDKLSDIRLKKCLAAKMHPAQIKTVLGRPIFFADFPRLPMQKPLGKVLVLGGVHGDEMTSVSAVLAWLSILSKQHTRTFQWRVVPLVNADGFFLSKSTRANANSVDLNRNLPTPDWDSLAIQYWRQRTDSMPAKYPGRASASEPETRWLIREIDEYQPDVIVSVHAPYDLVDFDFKDRSIAPKRLGILKGGQLGTFPGSLGNYASEYLGIPVITIELPDSITPPNKKQLTKIWGDLVTWLYDNLESIQKQETLVISSNEDKKQE